MSKSPGSKLSSNVGEKKARRLLVVFGDQLTADVPAFEEIEPGADVVLMMEVAEEATHVPSHRQRTVLFLSAMRHFALDLMEAGHRVRYVKLDDPHNTHSFTDEVERAVEMLGVEEVHVTHPGEHRVMTMVESWGKRFGVEVNIHDDAHFLTTPDDFDAWANGKKQLVMEFFYRQQRKDLDVMTKGGKPEGGEWNYDKENRKAFKETPRPEKPYQPRTDAVTAEVIDLVSRRFPDAPGELESFRWPVTREQALRALDKFVEQRLHRFGTYQDAMWTEQPWLYHSHLSSSLNLKLLNPREVYQAAVEALESGDAPINSVEGFVRQIIGWREFIRGVYWYEGKDYPKRNGLDQHGDLPEFYWNAETGMACMADSLGSVVEHAYGHHIQRLMVTGNFGLIAGVHPTRVHEWYLGMYIDAVEWATAPNTVGMAMHADHAVVGTKPYSASGKYIKRMSNYCEHCRYDPNKRTGEDACPFNTFYWDFLIRNEDRFKGNNRMAMILKNVERMNKKDKTEITVEGRRLRKEFGVGAVSR